MGKPTGFMEYKREVPKDIVPKDRIRNFNEFHEHLSMEKQQLQGARCMECGCLSASRDDPLRHDQRMSFAQSGAGME